MRRVGERVERIESADLKTSSHRAKRLSNPNRFAQFNVVAYGRPHNQRLL
jgi:hypothetical protein